MPTVVLRPNANGDLQEFHYQFPGSGQHWDKVDDITPDEDNSYVESVPVGGSYTDLYQLENLPPGVGVIEHVRFWFRARKVAAVLWSNGVRFKTYGTVYSGGTNYSYSTSYQNYQDPSGQPWSTNPYTGQPWTVAEVNALQAGMRVSPNFNFVRVTQVYVEVTYNPVTTPAVTTDPAAGIISNAAALNGTLDDDGGEACDCGFEWGTDTNYGSVTPTEQKSTGQTFSQVIAGLQPGTTYHFRAFATNAYGTGYSSDRSFTTLAVLPAVVTVKATDINVSGATLHGILTDDGGEASDCSFVWGLTAGYGNETPWQSGRHTGDAFVQPIAGLEADTLYHFRAFARNSAGVASGADMTFRTLKETIEAPPSLVDPSLKLLLEEET